MNDTAAAGATATMRSRTASILRDLRRTPLFRALVPMEAAVGWPIPIPRHREGKTSVFMKIPLYGMRPSPEKGIAAYLFPPFATMTLEWRSLTTVEYVNLRYATSWPESAWQEPVGTFPHEAARTTVGEYKAWREELLGRYDELFEMLAAGREPGDAWSAPFAALLRRLIEPALEPYYRELAPRFFERYLGPPDAPEGTGQPGATGERTDGR